MKKFILILIFQQVGFLAITQEAYFKEFDNEYNEELYDVTETEDGFAICGYTELNSNINNDKDGLLMRIDEIGNVVWSKQLNEDYFDRFERVLFIDGLLYVVGKTHPQNSNGNRRFWKYSIEGELLKSKDFGGIALASFDNQNYKLIDTGDGLIVAGSGSSNSTTSTDGELTKLDYLGNEVWSKKFNYDTPSITIDIVKGIEKEDDGFILFMQSTTTDALNHSEHIIKTDLNGNELWRKNVTNYPVPLGLELSGKTNTPSTITPYQDGYIMIVQAKDEFEKSFRTYLVELDEIGNEIKVDSFLDSIDHTVYNLSVNEKNEIYLSGLDMTEYSPEDWAWKHHLIKWNSNKELIWRKRQGSNNIINWYRHGSQTSDGGYISVGHIFRTSAPRRNPIIIKRDCQGNIVWNNSMCSITNSDSEYKVFPNPSSGIFFFHWNENVDITGKVYNALGQVIREFSSTNKSVFQLDLTAVADGVYSYTIIINNEVTINGKVLRNN